MTDSNIKKDVNNSVQFNIDIDAEEQHNNQSQQPTSKKKLPPAEFLWKEKIKKDIYNWGYDVDEAGTPILYLWDGGISEGYWKKANKPLVEKKVSMFLETLDENYFRNQNIKNCVAITQGEVYKRTGKLIKEDSKTYISTRSGVMEITKNKVTLINKDRRYLYRCHVDINIDESKVNGNQYLPNKNINDIEKSYFKKLIKDAFPDQQLEDIFQEFMGDLLCPTLRKAVPVLLGPPNGGKSKILEVIAGIIANSATADLSNLDGHATSSFYDAPVVLIDEIGKTINETQFKRMTGGALITINPKYKDLLSVQPNFKILAGANEMPRFSEKSGAIENRFFPFPVAKFKGNRINDIANKIIKNEKDIVLDYMIVGLQRVLERGDIIKQEDLPNSSMHVLREMKFDSNPALQWIEEVEVKVSDTIFTSTQEIYDNFILWAARQGRSGIAKISQNVFIREMLKPALEEKFENMEILNIRKYVITASGKVQCRCMNISFTNVNYNVLPKTFKDEREVVEDNEKDKVVPIKKISSSNSLDNTICKTVPKYINGIEVTQEDDFSKIFTK